LSITTIKLQTIVRRWQPWQGISSPSAAGRWRWTPGRCTRQSSSWGRCECCWWWHPSQTQPSCTRSRWSCAESYNPAEPGQLHTQLHNNSTFWTD